MPQKEKQHRSRQSNKDLTWKLSDAGISLPESLVTRPPAQKRRKKRNKKNRGKERPQRAAHGAQTKPDRKGVSMENKTQQNVPAPNVPPAGGAVWASDQVVKSFQPAVSALEEAGERVAKSIRDAHELSDEQFEKQRKRSNQLAADRELVSLAGYTLKGAVTFGFTAAVLALIGRAAQKAEAATPVTTSD